jgi:hypothetical protein
MFVRSEASYQANPSNRRKPCRRSSEAMFVLGIQQSTDAKNDQNVQCRTYMLGIRDRPRVRKRSSAYVGRRRAPKRTHCSQAAEARKCYCGQVSVRAVHDSAFPNLIYCRRLLVHFHIVAPPSSQCGIIPECQCQGKHWFPGSTCALYIQYDLAHQFHS